MQSLLWAKEEYWRRRGGLKWILKGDANTKYFHAYANGRRRRCAILRLQSDQRLAQEAITRHVYDFYIQLIGTSEEQRAGVRANIWDPSQLVTDQENEELGLAFLPEEIDAALKSMKTDTAPGPDGWPIAMFKHFWSIL